MSPPSVVIAAARQLQAECRRWCERHRALDPKAPLLILTPSPSVARSLAAALDHPQAVDLVAVEDFALNCLPSPDAVWRPPAGLDGLLAANLPSDLGRSLHPEEIPGLYLNLIDTILECRRHGIEAAELAKYGLAWAKLWQWVDDVLPDGVIDPYRLYQYASRSLAAPMPPYRAAWVHHAGLMPASAVPFLAELARLVQVTAAVEPRPGLAPHLRRWGLTSARRVRLPRESPKLQAEVLFAAEEQMVARALAVIGERGWSAPLEVLADDQGRGQDLVKRVRRDWGYSEEGPGRTAWVKWQRFWKVSQGSATRAETVAWLEDAGAGISPPTRRSLWRRARTWRQDIRREEACGRWLEWARGWGERALASPTPAALADRLEEAERRLEVVVNPDLKALRAMAHASLGLSPALIEELVLSPPAVVGGEPGAGGVDLVDALHRAGRVGGTVIACQGTARPGLPVALLPSDAGRRLGLGTLDGELTRFVWSHLADGADHVLYVVPKADKGRFLRSPAGQRAVEVASPPPSAAASRGLTANCDLVRWWYQSHRDRAQWDAWSGLSAERTEAMAASPSDFERYGRCPLAYFYRLRLMIDEPDGEEEPLVPSRSLIGRWAHQALAEVIGTAIDLGDPARLSARMAAAVARAATTLPPPPAVPTVVMEGVQAALAGELAEAVWLHRDRFAEPAETERELRWTYAGIEWRGRIDRLQMAGDGTSFTVLDFKTGDMVDPALIRPDNLQLALYREGVITALGAPRQRVAAWLVGVSARNRFRWFSLGDDPPAVERLRQVTEEIVRRIQTGRFHPLPAASDAPCRSCAYRLACPARIAEEARRKLVAADGDGFADLWRTAEDDDAAGDEEGEA